MGSRKRVKYTADVIDSIRSDWHISDDGADRGPIDGWPAPFLGSDDGNNAVPPRELRRAGSRSGQRFDGYPPGSSVHNLIPTRRNAFDDGGLNEEGRKRRFAQDAFANLRYEDAIFSRTGMGGPISAYRFLRKLDPGSDNTFAPRRGPHDVISTSATMAGAGELPGSTRTEVRSPTRTEVRSPTRTSTEAYTQGNFTATVTGGAGSGATSVTLKLPPPWGTPDPRGAGHFFGVSDAADIYDDISTWHHQTLEFIAKAGGKITPAQNQTIFEGYRDLQGAAKSDGKYKAVENAHHKAIGVVNQVWKGKPPPKLVSDLLVHHQNMQRALGAKTGIMGAVSSVGQGIAAVGKGIGSVGVGLASTVGKIAISPASLVNDIAHGKNVLDSVVSNVKDNIKNAKEIAPYVQAVISFVPGVGAGVNAAIAAGSALAHGQPITDALVAGMKGMVPGGPLATQALDTAYNLAKGQSITEAALGAARSQLPPGPAQTAFDTGIALAHGQKLQTALIEHGSKLLPGGATVQTAVQKIAGGESVVSTLAGAASEQGMSYFQNRLSPFASRAISSTGPLVGQVSRASLSVLPTNVKMAAQALLKNPGLRSLPVEDVARKLNLPMRDVQAAVASVVQAAGRTGMGQRVRSLATAPAIADRVGTATSFDQNLARFGSRMAPVAMGANRWAPRVLPRYPRLMPGAMGLQDAGAFATIKLGSSGPDVQAWQRIIKVTPDGKFGPQTDASTRAWQRSHGLTPDGVVGPKTWAAAGSTTAPGDPSTPNTTMTTGPGTVTIPEVVISAAPPPPLTQAQVSAANSMPTIRLGSKGPAVQTWQGILRRDSGISGWGGAAPDGQFGPITDAATKNWQKNSGIAPDGVVGPQTWKKGIGSLTTAPLPAESAPGVALPTPPPPNLPPGLPPIPTQPASAPAPMASVPTIPTLPPMVVTLPPVAVPLPPSSVGVTMPPSPPPAQVDKAGGAVAALAIGGILAKVMGFF